GEYVYLVSKSASFRASEGTKAGTSISPEETSSTLPYPAAEGSRCTRVAMILALITQYSRMPSAAYRRALVDVSNLKLESATSIASSTSVAGTVGPLNDLGQTRMSGSTEIAPPGPQPIPPARLSPWPGHRPALQLL